jgi:hypothetical protein
MVLLFLRNFILISTVAILIYILIRVPLPSNPHQHLWFAFLMVAFVTGAREISM